MEPYPRERCARRDAGKQDENELSLSAAWPQHFWRLLNLLSIATHLDTATIGAVVARGL